MTAEKEIKEAFDFIVNDYDDYMKKTNHLNAQKKIIELLAKEINGKVLDVATGTGSIALSVAKIPNTKVTGTDISEKMIEKAKEKEKKADVIVNFLVDNIEESAFSDKRFDTIICCLGAPWFTNGEKALKEMKRICKQDGKIILIEEEGETTRSKKEEQKGEQIFNERLRQFFSRIEKLEILTSIEEIAEKMNKIDYKLTKKVKAGIDKKHGFVGMVFKYR
jgi:demethylmenaquinone methyltransferase/2-methoxy-6-polyprenyl-1,4-benzoquinol methylase